MRRRHLLALSAGALAAAAALIASLPAPPSKPANCTAIASAPFSVVRVGLARRRLQRRRLGLVLRPAQRDHLDLLDARRDGGLKVVNLGPGAAPHGVVVGPDGAAWVTEGGQNAIASVDPADHRCSSGS